MSNSASTVSPITTQPALSFAELLALKGDPVVAIAGEIIKGTYDRSGFILYGGKSDGVLTSIDQKDCELAHGEETEFFVVRGENEDDEGCLAELSYRKAKLVRKRQLVWKSAVALVESKETATVEVKSLAKRKSDGFIVGVRVAFDGLEGFIPKSLLGPVGALEALIGQSLEVKVTKADEDAKDLMFNRRAVLEERADEGKEGARQFVENLKIGEVLSGTVCNTKEFGTFVSIGPVEGLVHVSELPSGSWRKLARGREVEVEVISADAEKGKVSLSILRPARRAFIARYSDKVGEVLVGRVENLINCAAFVEIEDGFSGFLHFSEVDSSFDAARKLLKVGSRIAVRIKEVRPQKNQMALSYVGEANQPADEVKAAGDDESAS